MISEHAPGREVFDRLKAEGWPLVESWRQARESETLHLEFKLKTDPSTDAIEDEDKAEIARTLSALANTEGGLLVVGVDAGGGRGKGFDRVTEKAPRAFQGSRRRHHEGDRDQGEAYRCAPARTAFL